MEASVDQRVRETGSVRRYPSNLPSRATRSFSIVRSSVLSSIMAGSILSGAVLGLLEPPDQRGACRPISAHVGLAIHETLNGSGDVLQRRRRPTDDRGAQRVPEAGPPPHRGGQV